MTVIRTKPGAHTVKVGEQEKVITVRPGETLYVPFVAEVPATGYIPFVPAEITVPTTLKEWIDQIGGAHQLKKDHALYVFLKSAGSETAAETVLKRIPATPSLPTVAATKIAALGAYLYSMGAITAGNAKTGLSYS